LQWFNKIICKIRGHKRPEIKHFSEIFQNWKCIHCRQLVPVEIPDIIIPNSVYVTVKKIAEKTPVFYVYEAEV